jgi:hypothetical protein
MTKYTTPTKTCSHCGLQKPLSAFLEMTYTHGVGYGNVCASCRKTNINTSKEADDFTGNKTEHKLDYKMRAQDEIDKRQRWKEIEEEYYEGRQLNEEKQNKTNIKSESLSDIEKKRRKEYLEKNTTKSSLFDNNRKSTNNVPVIAAGGIEQVAKESEMIVSDTIDTQKEKYKSSFFDFVKARFGESAGITSQSERALIMAKRAALDKKTINTNDTLSEKVEKLWPTGRKRK